MDINRFIGTLAARLEADGADKETAQRHAKAFVSSLPKEEAARLAAAADNESVIDRIAATMKKRIEAERADNGEDEDIISAMLASKERKPQPQRTAHRTTAGSRQRPSEGQRPQQAAQPQRAQPQGQQAPQSSVRKQEQPEMRRPQGGQTSRQITPQRAPSAHTQSGQTQSGRAQPRPSSSAGQVQRVIYKPDPNADYQKFWIILACSSPLWLFALFCVASLFALALGALCGLIVFLIAALFVGVAVGTVIALVGIIYGITQLFEFAPIGTYEIGLGIVIGGFVMFGGIIIYNVAVRLLPYLIKCVLKLLSFTIHKCFELYYYAKGACADL